MFMNVWLGNGVKKTEADPSQWFPVTGGKGQKLIYRKLHLNKRKAFVVDTVWIFFSDHSQ